jgi:ADP-ribose pyrophosphatase YjhB (NUDIX family)
VKFCSTCGASVSLRIPEGDNRERFVCTSCQTIHYQNPKIVAGTIPEWDGQILLCRRAIEPRYGLWTLPAGFMENGETTEQAAMRETWEEAGARIEILGLYSIFSIPHISQVYMLFRGELVDGVYEGQGQRQRVSPATRGNHQAPAAQIAAAPDQATAARPVAGLDSWGRFSNNQSRNLRRCAPVTASNARPAPLALECTTTAGRRILGNPLGPSISTSRYSFLRHSR